MTLEIILKSQCSCLENRQSFPEGNDQYKGLNSEDQKKVHSAEKFTEAKINKQGSQKLEKFRDETIAF